DPPLDLGGGSVDVAVAAVDVVGLEVEDLVEVAGREAETPTSRPIHEAGGEAVVDAVVVEADAGVVVARVGEAREELGDVEAEATTRGDGEVGVGVDAEARELADLLGPGQKGAIAGGDPHV